MNTDGQKVRVGIVGCGAIASAHVLAYLDHPHAELIGVHDADPARAAAFAAKHGTTAYSTLTELIKLAPDLISVATPPGSHTDLTVTILDGGCSVLLEKPPTINLADMDVLAAAEAASSGSVYVVFQHRHGSAARRAHQLLTSGALGSPQIAVCETLWYRPDSYFLPDWRGNWAGEGGGPTLGHGIHQIDLLLHLMGEWDSLDAKAARIARPVEFEDVSMAIVTFASGALGSVVTSLLSPRETSRIRIDTTGGTLEVEHLYGYSDADWSWYPAPGEAVAAANGRDPGLVTPTHGHTDLGDEANPWVMSAGTDIRSNHAAQIHQLIDDLVAGRPHETTLSSTRPTMEFVTALYASSIERETIRRTDLTPDRGFYHRLDGGLDAEVVAHRLTVS
ncbi:MAG: Gfo/Idh/MocA family oxidoreductase [Cryobacterium sp.]|nr:Gfo/Idh/MocA family oxidoreductase [Cryobacterium sp.]